MNENRQIFVFGSNLAGRHGKGAALSAVKEYGAIYGQGIGLQGNSYAIPTKDYKIKTLPLSSIRIYVEDFKVFADRNQHLHFNVTPIGCGLAGYKASQIAPEFYGVGKNVNLPTEFKYVLGDISKKEYIRQLGKESVEKYPVITSFLHKSEIEDKENEFK